MIISDKYPLLLAPMEDVTDYAFRLMCKRFGADMVYSEFVSSDALIRNVNKAQQKLTVLEAERPVAIQIYGKDVDTMREAAKICEAVSPDVIDLNFGCPVKKIAGKGAGAGLMRNIPLMLEITREVVKAVNTPVTVKTRLGWDNESKIIVELSEQLQDCGIEALAIHGRTAKQLYSGNADWTLIGKVKNNPRIHIPIIGNGDVDAPETAKMHFDRYGIDAIMIGRAAVGHPWIFQEIAHFLKNGTTLQQPPAAVRLDCLKQQALESIERLGERRGILHIRRHLAATPLFKGIPNFRETRIAMLRAETVVELFSILNTLPLVASHDTPNSKLHETDTSILTVTDSML
ncbi:MAG: tRNA dihydrouridine synthase DusB [Bacteroidales bacterium]|jgi:nifR3 family TIM-barrel protein|nr:tRNA dihydrouridine synthase DusB [Bacteroidales bacterium]